MLQAIWDWLNGNKAAMGNFLMAISGFLLATGVLDEAAAIYQLIVLIAGALGGTLGGVGVVHKIQKKNAEIKGKAE